MIRQTGIFYLGLFFCLISLENVVAQIKIDTTITEKFVDESQKIAPEILKKLAGNAKINGVCFYIKLHTDTINKSDYLFLKDEVQLGDEQGNIDEISEINETYFPTFFYAALKNDTLRLDDMLHFWNSRSILVNVLGKKLSPYLRENSKKDYIFSLNKKDWKQKINVPLKKCIVILDTKYYKIGDTITGSVEYVSERYFIKDKAFRKGYKAVKISGKYFFKTVITDSLTEQF